MHPAQPPAPPAAPREFGPEHEQMRARSVQPVAKPAGEVARAEPVDQQVHVHAARRRARQCIGHQLAGLVVGVEVTFEEHFAAGGVDGLDQSREILRAVPEQREAVAGDVLHAARGARAPR